MSLARDETHARFICHRNLCNFKGAVPMTALEQVFTKTNLDRPLKAPAKLEVILTELPDNVAKELNDRYQLLSHDINQNGIRWLPNEKRVWVPIFRLNGSHIGGVKRSLDKNVRPKSITHLWSTDAPLASFYRCRGQHRIKGSLWVVEDQFSAIRAARNCDSVALLGTNLSDQIIYEIMKADYSDITIALDKDAKLKALEMVKELSGIFNSVRFEPLDKDIKDMTPFQVYELMKEY